MKMNRKKFITSGALAAAYALAKPSVNSGLIQECTPSISMNPLDNKKALINPDMGWTMHFYSNNLTNYGSKLEPGDVLDDFPGLSTIYLRVPWSFIEREEGIYNWELLDTPSQRWIDRGNKIALRITASESGIRWATPEWVCKAGAKGFDWKYKDKEADLWEPAYDDPVFLEKAEQFIKQMASRYDNNPNVAFVDIGHFGLWGEGHTRKSGREYSSDVKKKHIDIYLNHFKTTLLCINDDLAAAASEQGSDFAISDYAYSKGVTLRDDSIMVTQKPWYHAEMAQKFWPSLPVILEHQHYGTAINRNTWNKDSFLQSVEAYHASYMSIHWWPRELLDANRDVIEKINLRMGYRINVKSISWPANVVPGTPFHVKTTWVNAGVAPCYPGGYPCITIKDEKGGIVSVLVDSSFNVKTLRTTSPPDEISVKLDSFFNIDPDLNDPVKRSERNVRPGKYYLYISVGRLDGSPTLALPYENHDGFKRYKMGEISLESKS